VPNNLKLTQDASVCCAFWQNCTTVSPYLTPGPGYTYPPGKVPPTKYPGEIPTLSNLEGKFGMETM
jgi:hypothetical protein